MPVQKKSNDSADAEESTTNGRAEDSRGDRGAIFHPLGAHQSAHRIAEKNLVGGFQIAQRQDRFPRLAAPQKLFAQRTGQEPARKSGCEQFAVLLDEKIGETALGELAALVAEDHFVGAMELLRLLARLVVDRAPCRLVTQERITGIHPVVGEHEAKT